MTPLDPHPISYPQNIYGTSSALSFVDLENSQEQKQVRDTAHVPEVKRSSASRLLTLFASLFAACSFLLRASNSGNPKIAEEQKVLSRRIGKHS